MAAPRAELVELRVLEGPNLYFPRPAIKLVLRVGPWLALPEPARQEARDVLAVLCAGR